MSDGNTHAIAQHLDEREDWDALQKVTTELEQAEARIEELEEALKFYEIHAFGCRWSHQGGDIHRGALHEDGGKVARTALATVSETHKLKGETG